MNLIIMLIGELNNLSSVMASGDKRGDDTLLYQEVNDNNESWSLLNMHHAPTFYRSAGYFWGFTSFLVIGSVIAYFFCCSGATKCLSHFNSTANNAVNTDALLLPTHAMQNLHHYMPVNSALSSTQPTDNRPPTSAI